MTQAFNLSQLANYVNTSGQLNGATGISGTVPSAATATTAATAQQVATTNFTIYESGGVLYFKHGSTNIISLDSSGNLTAL